MKGTLLALGSILLLSAYGKQNVHWACFSNGDHEHLSGWLFIGAGIIGILYYGNILRHPPAAMMAIVPVGTAGAVPLATTANSSVFIKLLLFFLKASALTFGSGLVIVPFLEQRVVPSGSDAAPVLAHHRGNANEQGFVKGAYAAAIGTILGACILLGKIAIGNWLTAALGIAALAILFRWKVNQPLLIAAAAIIGLIAFPLLQLAWVMVK